jgi:hypothetical protein
MGEERSAPAVVRRQQERIDAPERGLHLLDPVDPGATRTGGVVQYLGDQAEVERHGVGLQRCDGYVLCAVPGLPTPGVWRII